MFGAFGRSLERSSTLFVSEAAQAEGVGAALGLAKTTAAVKGTRAISKADMRLNDRRPAIEVHPETYEVRADGELLTCEPAEALPMAQRYFMY
jgi:urease subunit alpha